MNHILTAVRSWLLEVVEGWNRFWFTPAAPQTLAAIRVLGGLMIFYTHLVWTKNLNQFLGPDSWISPATSRLLHTDPNGWSFVWSYLWFIESPTMLWTLHGIALICMAMLTLGLFTRVSAIATWFITLSYCHRLEGSLFGLDQVNAMIATYLMIGAAGDAYSLDNWWLKRKQRTQNSNPSPAEPKISTNIAIRLLQVHMAVIYLFGGISKLRGEMWWDGSAVWFALANYEYQSLDITWLIQWRWLVALLTHVTVFWETFYPVLIWPKLTRPVMLALAVGVHGGIGLFLGMMTFGLAMLIGNLAFISPQTIAWLTDRGSKQQPTSVPSPDVKVSYVEVRAPREPQAKRGEQKRRPERGRH